MKWLEQILPLIGVATADYICADQLDCLKLYSSNWP
jgi:hypothetical protein